MGQSANCLHPSNTSTPSPSLPKMLPRSTSYLSTLAAMSRRRYWEETLELVKLGGLGLSLLLLPGLGAAGPDLVRCCFLRRNCGTLIWIPVLISIEVCKASSKYKN